MRADAIRNADIVLQTAAGVLARRPDASIQSIAAEAKVDRSTVYRRFENREALLRAILTAKMDAAEEAFQEARLDEAPVLVALHRWIEGTINASRRWPVERERLREDEEAATRADTMIERLDRFVARAQSEGVIDPALPVPWVRTLLTRATSAAAHDLEGFIPGRAADLVIRSLLDGARPPSSNPRNSRRSRPPR